MNSETGNPYQPVLVDDAEIAEYQSAKSQPASLLATMLRWTFVCVISATPSFAIGLMAVQSKGIGMLAGIAFFIALYSAIDYGSSQMRWRSNKSIRRTLKITYGTRIVISIIFPIGVMIDLYSGLLTTFATQAITGKQFTDLVENEIAAAFLGTIIHGYTLNVILGLFGLVVFGIVKAFEVTDKPG